MQFFSIEISSSLRNDNTPHSSNYLCESLKLLRLFPELNCTFEF